MPKYKVLIDKGWPLGAAIVKFGEVFASDDPRCAEDVERGYLEVTDEAVTPEAEEDATLANEAVEVVTDEAPPLIITAQMESDLREAGFDQNDIDKMTPEEAHDALADPAPK